MRRALGASLCAALLACTGGGVASAADVTALTARDDRPTPGLHVYRPDGVPRGSILVIHGGGWRDVGPAKLARIAPWAERFRSWGYEVWSTTYRPGRRSLQDVLDVYDAFRRDTPAYRPACIYGQSAGAHLGLMVAALRRGVSGVISAAGPTDLARLPRPTRSMAIDAFGTRLGRFSPLNHAGSIRARVLFEHGSFDRLVPLAQSRVLAGALPGAAVAEVPGRATRSRSRSIRWVHGYVSPATSRRIATRERAWLAETCSVLGR